VEHIRALVARPLLLLLLLLLLLGA